MECSAGKDNLTFFPLLDLSNITFNNLWLNEKNSKNLTWDKKLVKTSSDIMMFGNFLTASSVVGLICLELHTVTARWPLSGYLTFLHLFDTASGLCLPESLSHVQVMYIYGNYFVPLLSQTSFSDGDFHISLFVWLFSPWTFYYLQMNDIVRFNTSSWLLWAFWVNIDIRGVNDFIVQNNYQCCFL